MSWGQGTPWAWRKVRAEVLDRDEHTCRLRFACCLDEATQVHHVESITATGTLRADALDASLCIAVCEPCHRIVTAEQSRIAKWHKAHRTPRAHPLDAMGAIPAATTRTMGTVSAPTTRAMGTGAATLPAPTTLGG